MVRSADTPKHVSVILNGWIDGNHCLILRLFRIKSLFKVTLLASSGAFERHQVHCVASSAPNDIRCQAQHSESGSSITFHDYPHCQSNRMIPSPWRKRSRITRKFYGRWTRQGKGNHEQGLRRRRCEQHNREGLNKQRIGLESSSLTAACLWHATYAGGRGRGSAPREIFSITRLSEEFAQVRQGRPRGRGGMDRFSSTLSKLTSTR